MLYNMYAYMYCCEIANIVKISLIKLAMHLVNIDIKLSVILLKNYKYKIKIPYHQDA